MGLEEDPLCVVVCGGMSDRDLLEVSPMFYLCLAAFFVVWRLPQWWSVHDLVHDKALVFLGNSLILMVFASILLLM